jgi:hypothetical protein
MQQASTDAYTITDEPTPERSQSVITEKGCELSKLTSKIAIMPNKTYQPMKREPKGIKILLTVYSIGSTHSSPQLGC